MTSFILVYNATKKKNIYIYIGEYYISKKLANVTFNRDYCNIDISVMVDLFPRRQT